MAESPAKTIQIIFNRAAGGHCPKKVEALRAGFEANGARVVLSECGPAVEIAISEEAGHVCVLGGDGTVRHVAIALSRCGRTLPVSIYPTGTVNLLHREIGSPADPHGHALHVISGEGARGHYPAAINDTLFLACASAGPDSRAVAAVSPALKRRIGTLAYLVAFCGILIRWRRSPIRLSWEGTSLDCEAFYVAKGRFFAGPWSFAPEARLDRPLLHVVALRTATRLGYLRFVWAMLRGSRLDRLGRVSAFTCTGFTADCSEPIPVQADGDVVASLPAKVQLAAAPMTFC